MSDARKVHLKGVYHLPSWQGGDVVVPRCRMSREGYTPSPGLSMSDDLSRVDCAMCRMRMAAKPRPERSPATFKGPSPARPRPPAKPALVVERKPPMEVGETMQAIARDVARRYQLRLDDLRGPARLAYIVHARHEAFALCYATGRHSTTKIGLFFGRDHATVIHGIRMHKLRSGQLAEAA